MTQQQTTHRPPITDLWLLVDEEQTLRLGMRQAWHWLESEHGVQHRTASPAPRTGAGASVPQVRRLQHATARLA
jgi:hypothetical protein